MAKRKKRARPPLDDRHRLAIELLTTVPTPTLEETAQACGVDRRTLYRWRNRTDFKREMRKVQDRKMNEFRRGMRRQFDARIANVKDLEAVFNALRLIP